MAEESHYPLQLSKELNISQQAIMKHLKVLEDNDLVISFEEKSTLGGPPRKVYISKKSITLRIDVGPNTFNSEVYDYKKLDDREAKVKSVNEDMNNEFNEFDEFGEKFSESQKIEDNNRRLTEYSKIIQEINSQLEDLKMRRAKLISLRESIIKKSNRIITECCNEYDERKILYYLLTHQNRDLETISETMEMRIKAIEEIFKNLMKQHLFIIEDDEF